MAGTYNGAKEAVRTNKRRYGEDFYSRIGKKGGLVPKTKPSGFAAMPKSKVRAAGRKGGKITAQIRWGKNAKRV
jgi:general stress protein YciG